MSRRIFRIRPFILTAILFLIVSAAYAETAIEYFNQGVTYYDDGNFSQAVVEYTKAIDLDYNYAEAYCGRGFAYLELNEFAKAIADFKKAIGIDRNYAEAYYGRGLAYYGQKNFSLGQEDVHRAESLGYNIYPRFSDDLKRIIGKEE